MLEAADLIDKPTLLVDIHKVEINVKGMIKKASEQGVILRPHFKTHQSAEIGALFRDRGVSAIAVSSVDMAEYFAAAGWHDITIAFPLNLRQMKRINELARRIHLGILIESLESLMVYTDAIQQQMASWIKIDTGYHRTGIEWFKAAEILELAEHIDNHQYLDFEGILTHAGQTYKASSVDEIRAIFSETNERMAFVKDALAVQGYHARISVGDTPGSSTAECFGEIDEIRPGNFVYYDLMQLELGVCEESDIAAVVACPIVAKNKDRMEIVIYGGAVHLSKEFISGIGGTLSFGRIALLNNQGWSPSLNGCWISTLSQEHGIVKSSELLMNSVNIGDLLVVLPVHSCLAANLLKNVLTTDGQSIAMARI